jgi:hypothetical protein
MEEIIDEYEILETGPEVDEDIDNHIPRIIGELSRSFDKNFPERYLRFYKKLSNQNTRLEAIKEIKDCPVKFIEYCCRTMSRDKQSGKITVLCFELFETQKKAISQMLFCWKTGKPAVFLKSRQQGASWLSICFAFWVAVFHPHENILCTSKSDEDLHEINKLKSLMEKFVFLYRNLHPMLKKDIIYKFEYKKYLFQINDSIIDGGLGSDPARGGSYTLSINDEFAYNKYAEEVIASLDPCCKANFYISTRRVKNDPYDLLLNNPYYEKIRLFWRDDPQIKDKERYKIESIASMGQHKFNVEIDMQYSDDSALLVFERDVLDGVKLLNPDTPPEGYIIAGFDVAAMGPDYNCLIIRQGHTILYKSKWNKVYAKESVRKILEIYETKQKFDILFFDEIGVGYSIASEFNDMDSLPFMVQGISVNSDAGEEGVDDNLLEEEEKMIYFNLRAKLHWTLRTNLENTFSNRNISNQSEKLFLKDEEIINEMYNIPLDDKSVRKIKILPKREIRKLMGGKSPNCLDSLLLTYSGDSYLNQMEIETYLYSTPGMYV